MNIFIVGSGRVGSDLAKMLSISGHNVVLIDINPDAFKKLGSSFNGLTITGSGTDEILLRDIKADKADIFVAITDKDNINIMSAQIAKFIFKIPKVIVKLTDTEREIILRKQDIDIVSGTRLISAFIWNEISIKPYKTDK
ncbi:MAG: NAD-binding protein [Candidatus Firestonebacteria bacterium]|nr:NAD-binding protein [Candidatus Firestonebacteria bacterium]